MMQLTVAVMLAVAVREKQFVVVVAPHNFHAEHCHHCGASSPSVTTVQIVLYITFTIPCLVILFLVIRFV